MVGLGGSSQEVEHGRAIASWLRISVFLTGGRPVNRGSVAQRLDSGLYQPTATYSSPSFILNYGGVDQYSPQNLKLVKHYKALKSQPDRRADEQGPSRSYHARILSHALRPPLQGDTQVIGAPSVSLSV